MDCTTNDNIMADATRNLRSANSPMNIMGERKINNVNSYKRLYVSHLCKSSPDLSDLSKQLSHVKIREPNGNKSMHFIPQDGKNKEVPVLKKLKLSKVNCSVTSTDPQSIDSGIYLIRHNSRSISGVSSNEQRQ